MNETYEYESEELDEEVEYKRKRIIKGIFFTVLILVIIIIILLLLKGCQKEERNKYDDLLKAGKAYYEKDKNLLPKLEGECEFVTLNSLLNSNLIEFKEDYEICDKQNTIVKVCKLESGIYHYTPVLKCNDVETTFGSCINGKETDLEKDTSNVEFLFKGYRLKVGVKKYYSTDTTDVNAVKEYYVEAPNNEYNLKDGEGVTAYKWYKMVPGGTVYWNNGAYSATKPSGEWTRGNSKTNLSYTNTKPATGTYETGTWSRVKYVAGYRYKCVQTGGVTLSPLPCDSVNLEYATKDPKESIVTVCVNNSAENIIVKEGTVCKDFTEWTTGVCDEGKNSSITGKVCENAKYKVTETTYQWYTKASDKKEYYKNSKGNENVYFVDAPAAGYTKDTATEQKAYKYYKFVELKDGQTDKNQIEEWIPVTEKFVTKEEMLKAFEEAKYEIKSLKEIKENDKFKYELQLKYCNRK